MPFYIKRNEVGEIANVRYVFHIDGTEFEDACRGTFNVIADDESEVTVDDRAKVAKMFGEYLEGGNQQLFPFD